MRTCVIAIIFIFFALPAYAGLSLMDSGTGISEVVAVTSSGQFEVDFSAADNWGMSAWYDLVNDSNKTTNLTSELAQVGTENDEAGVYQQVVDPNDLKTFMYAAQYDQPTSPRSMTILKNTPNQIILQTVYYPIIHAGINSDLQFTSTYYIYPNGQIYINTILTGVGTTQSGDITNGPIPEWCNLVGLADPAYGTVSGATADPDLYGWLRCTDTQCPYNYSSTAANYLFEYWDPTTPSPYTNYTKASILFIQPVSPNTPNPYAGSQWHHEWSNWKRWGFNYGWGTGTLTVGLGQKIIQNYMIQLGTQGSSVLPNINSTSVAGPIATAYQANPNPPAASNNAIFNYVNSQQSTSLNNWIANVFNYDITSFGGNVNTGLTWMSYKDIYGPGSISELLAMKDWATSNSVLYEPMLVHANIDYNSPISGGAFVGMDQFDAWEGANGVLSSSNGTTFVDQTATAYSGNVTWQSYMYFGYEEAFDQINLTFNRAGAGLTYVWQYWNGTTWTTLTVTDGTSNLTTTGQVLFTPPSTWARASINSSRSKYFVRCYISAATTYPISATIKGDKWLLTTGGVTNRGWSSTDSHIVNSGQLTYNPTPPSGSSAKFPYQARISYWGANEFTINPANSQTLDGTSQLVWPAYIAYYFNATVTSNPGITGFMGDDAEKVLSLANDGIAPSSTDYGSGNWATDSTTKLAKIVSDTTTLNSNIKVGINAIDTTNVQYAKWNVIEGYLPPYKLGSSIVGFGSGGSNMQYGDYASANNPNGIVGVFIYDDNVTTTNSGYSWDLSNRGPISALSWHYIGNVPNYTEFAYNTNPSTGVYGETDQVYMNSNYNSVCPSPGTIYPVSTNPSCILNQSINTIPSYTNVLRWATYFPAMGVNIGIPNTSGWNSGAEGTWNGFYRRDYISSQYGNAIVLNSPAAYNTTSSQYSTYQGPYSLGGTYYPLYADGTIGTAITSISLRGGEGAILLSSGGGSGTITPPTTSINVSAGSYSTSQSTTFTCAPGSAACSSTLWCMTTGSTCTPGGSGETGATYGSGTGSFTGLLQNAHLMYVCMASAGSDGGQETAHCSGPFKKQTYVTGIPNGYITGDFFIYETSDSKIYVPSGP